MDEVRELVLQLMPVMKPKPEPVVKVEPILEQPKPKPVIKAAPQKVHIEIKAVEQPKREPA